MIESKMVKVAVIGPLSFVKYEVSAAVLVMGITCQENFRGIYVGLVWISTIFSSVLQYTQAHMCYVVGSRVKKEQCSKVRFSAVTRELVVGRAEDC